MRHSKCFDTFKLELFLLSRKNFLFCIDDVDACNAETALPTFVKFFTERRTWFSKNAGVVHYPNQVCFF